MNEELIPNYIISGIQDRQAFNAFWQGILEFKAIGWNNWLIIPNNYLKLDLSELPKVSKVLPEGGTVDIPFGQFLNEIWG